MGARGVVLLRGGILTNTPPSQTDARPFIFGIVSLHVSTVETQSEGGDSHQPDLWWHLFNQL